MVLGFRGSCAPCSCWPVLLLLETSSVPCSRPLMCVLNGIVFIAQVLLDFLRLLRQRKVAETQAVRNQLAGLETDCTEAQSRLERVLTSAATARQLPLPAGDRLAAAMRAASSNADAEPSSAVSPADMSQQALRSRSLPSPSSPLRSATATADATAAPASEQSAAVLSRKRPRDENDDQGAGSEGKQAAATRVQSPAGVLTASKVARIMAAFPAADVAYLSRRAEAKLAGRRTAAANARAHVRGVQGALLSQSRGQQRMRASRARPTELLRSRLAPPRAHPCPLPRSQQMTT